MLVPNLNLKLGAHGLVYVKKERWAQGDTFLSTWHLILYQSQLLIKFGAWKNHTNYWQIAQIQTGPEMRISIEEQ